ncbi:uncharacterized protein CELE_M05B5.7 [Caenorhabditis elegans]|uniref:Uncharacterized protein n=1 Tax=Caenorhabditis elegans TaxID=6239 RepID=C6KRL3_CAEEL|nr:Uncharacterized protein CELE_M05B5.7 [Caenorhabditis elegans]CAZ65512.1 Uncharacterized protein CELE_M05B5.7 [Caenorhabditis elegans]|eukprot:NP_001250414.1 Uncharacterized protein CELE_M05B5.7 [Caenorhabditis elegans]
MFVDVRSKTLESTFVFLLQSLAFLVFFYFLKTRIKTNKIERHLRLLERKHENEWILLEPAHCLSKIKAMQCLSEESLNEY